MILLHMCVWMGFTDQHKINLELFQQFHTNDTLSVKKEETEQKHLGRYLGIELNDLVGFFHVYLVCGHSENRKGDQSGCLWPDAAELSLNAISVNPQHKNIGTVDSCCSRANGEAAGG